LGDSQYSLAADLDFDAAINESDLQAALSRNCSADFAAPFGVADAADIAFWTQNFVSLNWQADLAAPFNVFDLADSVAFITAFNLGCP